MVVAEVVALLAWVITRALESDGCYDSPPPPPALQLLRHLMAVKHMRLQPSANFLARNKTEEATKNTKTDQKDLN